MYSSILVAESKSCMSKFVCGVSKDVVNKCMTTVLVKKMDISWLMVHAQQIKKEKILEKERVSKRGRTCSFNFTQQRSIGVNYSQFYKKSSTPAPRLASDIMPMFRQDNQNRA